MRARPGKIIVRVMRARERVRPFSFALESALCKCRARREKNRGDEIKTKLVYWFFLLPPQVCCVCACVCACALLMGHE